MNRQSFACFLTIFPTKFLREPALGNRVQQREANSHPDYEPKIIYQGSLTGDEYPESTEDSTQSTSHHKVNANYAEDGHVERRSGY